MAPKPGYRKFDLGKDELMILYSDTPDTDIAEGDSEFSMTAEFWNIDGDRFNTDTCNMTLTDSDGDTYWDSFALAEDEDNCPTYGGRSGLIQYILQTQSYESFFFTEETTGKIWNLATYEEMYATQNNGGRFPWDPEPQPTMVSDYLGFFTGNSH